jgi:hypothetical protein
MRTVSEIQTKIDHLAATKEEALEVFKVFPLSKHKHAELSAFVRAMDNEMDVLRWVLGQLDKTWSEHLLEYIDIVHYFEHLPPTDYPRLPHRQELAKTNRPAAS